MNREIVGIIILTASGTLQNEGPLNFYTASETDNNHERSTPTFASGTVESREPRRTFE
jgi:hypothetical protein